MKADLHCHTIASHDAISKRDDIIAACQRQGLGCLAITDHNRLTIWSDDRVKLIPGEEIMTSAGEIIGLFLSEEIPPFLDPLETVQRIKVQGGLVYVPHPFDRFRRGSPLGPAALAEVAPYVDIIEGLNARSLLSRDDQHARDWAKEHGLPLGAGSDAHSPGEIGMAYVELGDFATPSEFLARLAHGSIGGRRSPFWVPFYSTWGRLRKRHETQTNDG